jgi:hypothetical protein
MRKDLDAKWCSFGAGAVQNLTLQAFPLVGKFITENHIEVSHETSALRQVDTH